LKFGRKVLHKVSSKQNDRCAIQAQPTETSFSLNWLGWELLLVCWKIFFCLSVRDKSTQQILNSKIVTFLFFILMHFFYVVFFNRSPIFFSKRCPNSEILYIWEVYRNFFIKFCCFILWIDLWIVCWWMSSVYCGILFQKRV
jgi:hypothetical protein